MTVAAVILAASSESALADADGQPRARRLVEAAWAGGAVPVIVVAPDPAGEVAAALVGAPATLLPPAAPESGPVGQIARGIDAAAAGVTGTDAALIWPARLAWVDPETVTSLIEAHGVDPDRLLRPAYRGEPGWPVLLPLAHLDAFRAGAPDLMPDDLVTAVVAAGTPERSIELGDPGTTIDGSTPRSELPAYEGPSEPAGGHVHEWGATAAEAADDVDVALEGPGLAPYGQAGADDPDQPG
jgi:CTP:molybdopterin cytidylyltransferase MocA